RGFTAAEGEPGTSAPVVVISDGLWGRRYAGATDIVGRTLTLNGQVRTIIGVARVGGGGESTSFLDVTDVWLPLAAFPNPHGLERGQSELFAIGRVAAGTTMAAAEAELDAVADGLARIYPQAQAGRTVVLQPLASFLVDRSRAALLLLFAAAGMVLVISCVNVANLSIPPPTPPRNAP